jgi:membrane dipeptidase
MSTRTPSADEVHRSALVIDAHADTPQRFLDEHFDPGGPLDGGSFNLESARQGNLAAQFFAIWVEPSRYSGQFSRRALELIDAVKRQATTHADRMELALSAEGIERAHRAGKLAALMGIEGGHSIEHSLGLLHRYHALGARYMTLTWNNSNGWADSSGDLDDASAAHTQDGLSKFGIEVLREMNHLGMMVDVSHASDRAFYRALEVSRAPVIASHSCARALCDSPRNLTDQMLRDLAGSGGPHSKGGVVQVNFYSAFVSSAYRGALRRMQPEIEAAVAEGATRAKSEGRAFPCREEEKIRRSFMDRIPRPPLSALIDHIDHIARIAGVDHVGLGSDFDGVYGQLPEGIDSPADLPRITEALLARGYAPEDCRKILGGNLLRVFREVEEASRTTHARDSC